MIIFTLTPRLICIPLPPFFLCPQFGIWKIKMRYLQCQMDNLQYNPMAQNICGVGDAHNMVMYLRASPPTCHHKHHSRGVICGLARVMMGAKPPPQPCYCIRKGPHKIKLMHPSQNGNFLKYWFIKRKYILNCLWWPWEHHLIKLKFVLQCSCVEHLLFFV